MKPFIKNIINEAKVQRTIDSKIWASMSSMSSKNRANLALDVKPMRKELDNKEVLLQKYVAGLLTIKAACPATEDDIKKIKAYQNFGEALINAGGTMTEIQKLYVENGGLFDGEILEEPANEPEPEYPPYEDADDEEPATEPEPEYPPYEDAGDDEDLEDEPIDEPINEPNEEPESKGFDAAVANKLQTKEEPDFPPYEDADDEAETFGEKFGDMNSLKHYFKTVGSKLRRANVGDYLVWDNNEGLVISNNAKNAIAKCVLTTYNTIDKKPRFMSIRTTTGTLGNAGNNNVYDSYYFKKDLDRGRLVITPGSKYYAQEEVNGKFYTNILIDNGNTAAAGTKSLIDIVSNDLTDEQKNIISELLKDNIYLPTLPELSKCIKQLPKGNYWTSTVEDDGTTNVILGVNPDKLYKVNRNDVNAIIVAFLSF